MSNKTIVVNLFHEEYDQYIGRAGKGKDGYFGNPFSLKPGQDRGSTINNFRNYFNNRIKNDPEFKERVEELKGKRLGCFCKQKNKEVPCHGDIYVEYLEKI